MHRFKRKSYFSRDRAPNKGGREWWTTGSLCDKRYFSATPSSNYEGPSYPVAGKFSLKILAFHRNNEEGARIKNKEWSNRFFTLRIVIKNDLHFGFLFIYFVFFFFQGRKSSIFVILTLRICVLKTKQTYFNEIILQFLITKCKTPKFMLEHGYAQEGLFQAWKQF